MSEESQESQKKAQVIQQPRISLKGKVALMVISILSSLLLYAIDSFPPLFSMCFLSLAISLVWNAAFDRVDPENNLNIELGKSGYKASINLMGSIVVFIFMWGLTTWYIDQRDQRVFTQMTELDIDNQKTDQRYVYIIRPLYSENEDKRQEVGRIKLKEKLEDVYNVNQFDPILVQIRNECYGRQGLCKLPKGWFDVKIEGENKELEGLKVSVCSGHEYLLTAKRINLSDNGGETTHTWTLDSLVTDNILPTNQSKITPDTPINISQDVDQECPSSNQNTYPRIRVSTQLKQQLEQQSFQFHQKIQARTIE